MLHEVDTGTIRKGDEEMSQHPSLKTKRGSGHRSVLKRFERLKYMVDKDKWNEAMSIFGLPKIKLIKFKIKKEKPIEAAAEGEVAAEGAAPAAGDKAAAPKAGAEKPAAGKAKPEAKGKAK